MITFSPEDSELLGGRALHIIRNFNRGGCTEDELVNELLVDLEPWAPGHREHAAKALAIVARSAQAPINVLECAYMYGLPSTRPPLDPLIDETVARAAAERAVADEVADLARTVAWWRPLPAVFIAALADLGEVALVSAILLRDGLREGDAARVREALAEACGRGCIGPLRLAVSYLGILESGYVVDLLARFDLDALRDEGRWGTLAAGAAVAARFRAPEVALRWSGAVETETLEPWRPNAPLSSYHGWDCDEACRMTSTQLLGVLSAVDLVCGARERAVQRARSMGQWDWFTAADEALAQWVIASTSAQSERPGLLAAIRPRHTWLGLLRAQIEDDLADLATTPSEATEHRRRRDGALTRPEIGLHVGGFNFMDAMWALPVSSEVSHS